MSGHSKWSKVKHIKAVEDVKKGKAFSKASREITIAARKGGGDPDTNPALSSAIERAKEVNMPKDNIESAIKKGTGEDLPAGSLENVIFEGYGPSGVAFLVTAQTDNRNRTVSDVRKIFTQYGGSLGSAGSTSYIFEDNEPIFTVPVDDSAIKLKISKLVDDLGELDDVTSVRTNMQK